MKNIQRKEYLEKIARFIDKPVIKIITGMRRAGKSFLMRQVIDELKTKGINPKSILYINMDLVEFDHLQNYKDLNHHIKKYFKANQQTKYLFIDEVQNIDQWEKTINSIFTETGTDIYLTGSNAGMLSSELSTHLSGRYIELPLHTLNFNEFLKFRKNPDKDREKEFLLFLRYGGLPAIHQLELEDESIYPYIRAIYNTILLKDVVARYQVRSVNLLENITEYVFDNIGNNFSAKRIADYLKSQQTQVGVDTIQNYLKQLESAYLINKVKRYDLKGKKILEVNEKYFLGDIGIRHSVLGYRENDISGILENVVYLELLRRGYKVNIGKQAKQEIDFVASKENEKIYIQVCYLLASEETISREFEALLAIKDNYPKYVLSMDKLFGNDYQGIQRLNIIDFLQKPTRKT
ncbi:MAG: ATP-binding protein [Candidatus Melainabacteria bacterium]|nr:ATP-binding protein [Candidatus Melainabacteria bacterium]